MTQEARTNKRSLTALKKLSLRDAFFKNVDQNSRLWKIRMGINLPLTQDSVYSFMQATQENAEVRKYYLKESWI